MDHATQLAALISAARDDMMIYSALVDPRYKPNRFHRYLARILEDAVKAGRGRIMIFSPPQHGKQLADDTPVLTPDGWVNHGDLQVGSKVVGSNGSWTEVIAVGAPGEQDVRVTFADGEVIDCHENHLWQVRDRKHARGCKDLVVMSTRDMESQGCWLNPQGTRGSRIRFSVAWTAVKGGYVALPVEPYTLGAWLGDGYAGKPCICHAKKDCAVVDEIRRFYDESAQWVHADTGVITVSFGGTINRAGKLACGLRCAGVYESKHIPGIYLASSEDQRLRLLAGLIDTDGSYHRRTNRYCISGCNHRLMLDIAALVRSFGWRATIADYSPVLSSSGIQGKQVVYQVSFSPDRSIPCLLERKRNHGAKALVRLRGIVSIERVAPTTGRCIQVAAGDGIYLAGKGLIRTHNSEIVSRKFPAWVLGKHPDWPIIAASYGDDLVEFNGSSVRQLLESNVHRVIFPMCELDPAIKARTNFQTTQGAKYLGVTVRGGGTGFPAKVFIIDDPFKSRSDADSDVYRGHIKNWYRSVVYPRLAENSILVIMHTRWHDDDLAGWLLREQTQENWRVVSLPAIAEENDELGRQPGEALVPERFSAQALDLKRISVGSREWLSLYQQTPPAEGGGEFRREFLKYYDQGQFNERGHAWSMNRYILVDPARTLKRTSDYTAMLVIGLGADNNYYLLDAVYDKLNLRERGARLIELHRKWQPLGVGYKKTGFEGDIDYLTEAQSLENYRFPVTPLPDGGDKNGRIRKLLPDFEAGRWWLPGTMWRTGYDFKSQDLIEIFVHTEYLPWPAGRHDDWLDCMAAIKDMPVRWPSHRAAVHKLEQAEYLYV